MKLATYSPTRTLVLHCMNCSLQMGIMEGYPRKPNTHQHQSLMDAHAPAGATSSATTHAPPPAPHHHHATLKKRHHRSDRAKTILLFAVTNSISILLSIAFSHLTGGGLGNLVGASDDGEDSTLDFAFTALSSRQSLAVDLHNRIEATDALIKRLISNSGKTKRDAPPPRLTPDEELTVALGPHTLPFGYTPNLDSDRLYPAVGAACHRHRADLTKFMKYNVSGDCPAGDDAAFAEKLMLKGCEPLPRRRCRARGPKGFPDPTPFPESLWVVPPDTSVSWAPYHACKNYSCLVNRARRSPAGTLDGFDLTGKEQKRWVGQGGGDLEYDIDTVLASKPRGTIRIGLDIGGTTTTGTFAARMAERGVTVVTATMDMGAPFGAFVASRGLVPLHLGNVAGRRLPFFDGTLDIVHASMVNALGAVVMLEAELYDVFRVLRPGGVFWLDHFLCTGKEMIEVYAPVIEGVGFRKLRWNTGKKVDKGNGKADEWYISALLERPMM